jgi:hypothetical protein
VLCSSKLESWRHNTVYCTPAVPRRLVLSLARDSRPLRCTRRGATAGRAGFDNVQARISIRGAHCLTGHHANGRGERPLPWGSQALGPERAGGWLRASRAAWRDSVAARPHGILGKRLTEKRVSGTRKAAEPTGGDCWRSSRGRDSGRRREASWSRGAAECDRRPMFRRTSSAAPGSATRVSENLFGGASQP